MPQRPKPSSHSSSAWSWPLAGVCLLLTFGFCAVAAVMLAQLRQDAWRSAQRDADNILQTVSADIARNIEVYDLSLQSVVDALKLPGLADLSPDLRREVLFDRAATAKYLGSMVVVDERGMVVHDASTAAVRHNNLADREYFRFHRQQPDAGLFISAPFRLRLTGDGDLVVAMSRRINHPDGSFAGVVVGTLRIDYFLELFRHLSVGTQGAIALVRTDGTLLARNPYDPAVIGRNVAGGRAMLHFDAAQAGSFQGPAGLDGVQRVTNFLHIGTLPLVLSVSVAETDIYAAWNSRAAVIGGVLLGLCAAVGVLGLMFSRELRRRARAERKMRASEAQYRLLAEHATDVIARFGPSLVLCYVSPSCRVVLGYEPEDLVGRPASAVVHAEDWELLVESIDDAQRKGMHCAATYRMIHKDGGTVWVEGHYSYMEVDGGFSVVLRDIGARKLAEQELAAAYAELTRVAATDALTGIANRRQFDDVLGQEWRRAMRNEQPLTLLLLDVDRFKLFNDRYGHPAGDACLHAIAQAIAGCALRPADLVARYGGEEIVVLLPDTDSSNAVLMGERVRAAVATLALRHEGNDAQGGIVTVSVGVATAIPPRPDMSGSLTVATPTALIAAADQMLYAAKRQGRNRVMVYEPSPVISGVQTWLEAEPVS